MSSAWLGVNDIVSDGTFRELKNPRGTATVYDPVGGTSQAADDSMDCVVMHESTGEWENVVCEGGTGIPGVVCRIPSVDNFGYDSSGTGR